MVFQSTLPCGSDCKVTTAIHEEGEFQSTLPYGSDVYRQYRSQRHWHFNPRSLTGATAVTVPYTEQQWTFQSTLPRRSDKFQQEQNLPDSDFNPRSLAGATAGPSAVHQASAFQSTLPRGSDKVQTLINIIAQKFQSTLPRGSDARSLERYGYSKISIHAPSRERLQRVARLILQPAFQSTLPRGSDIFSFMVLISFPYFNPRSLAGATADLLCSVNARQFQSTLPRGSDGR